MFKNNNKKNRGLPWPEIGRVENRGEDRIKEK